MANWSYIGIDKWDHLIDNKEPFVKTISWLQIILSCSEFFLNILRFSSQGTPASARTPAMSTYTTPAQAQSKLKKKKK